MLTVSQLKHICEQVEKRYEPNALVRIQLRDEDGRLIEQDECTHAGVYTFTKDYKILVLTNYNLDK